MDANIVETLRGHAIQLDALTATDWLLLRAHTKRTGELLRFNRETLQVSWDEGVPCLNVEGKLLAGFDEPKDMTLLDNLISYIL